MKDEERKKRKGRKKVISYFCKKGKKISTNILQQDRDEHESMFEDRCEETDVLIVKPDAMRKRRMCSKKKLTKTIIEIGYFDKQ
eukprot:883260-Ditylum_brightwellii.AAC.1